MTPPLRYIERLGKNHSEGLFRVQVNATLYRGETEREAITNAFFAIMEEHSIATISITPNLPQSQRGQTVSH